ncbi:DUF3179 domain-containing (seleno)protein [Roseivirga sp. E12]|uniref:DUF3179 domain-containing (seleno)protein n=1 Tax=Roseivirga sp. E12 TaxID=2819237 RepID=UPI001ABCEDF1|nr:DUF3179 domain-containing (seleno)protein [Roseivirga sp. E12]MBO3699257.1 DUF3179 domain-containing protein [Roseivirga sp. E12]
MKKPLLTIACILLLAFSCAQKEDNSSDLVENTAEVLEARNKRPVAIELGKFFEKDGRKYQYGGEDSTWHFDITNSILKDEQFHYGIGREKFMALIDPDFITQEEADQVYPDSARFLLLQIGEDVRAYGIDLLTRHEIVNDVVNGQPVMAAYCILADLGAVYHRVIGEREFTFALSGYTYYDPEVWDGMDGFVFWDRETESTWWPLVGKAVSGPLLETPLTVYNEQNWSQTTWGEIKSLQHSQLKVLKPGQTMEAPSTWPKYKDLIEGAGFEIKNNAVDVAPKWGENKSLEKD